MGTSPPPIIFFGPVKLFLVFAPPSAKPATDLFARNKCAARLAVRVFTSSLHEFRVQARGQCLRIFILQVFACACRQRMPSRGANRYYSAPPKKTKKKKSRAAYSSLRRLQGRFFLKKVVDYTNVHGGDDTRRHHSRCIPPAAASYSTLFRSESVSHHYSSRRFSHSCSPSGLAVLCSYYFCHESFVSSYPVNVKCAADWWRGSGRTEA